MNKKEKSQLVKRREILTAAYQLSEEKLIQNVTMRDVSKKSEYTLRTIYHYFSSKEEMFYDLLTTIMEEKAKWLEPIIKSNQNPIQQLFAYFYANFEYLNKYPVELKIVYYLQSSDYNNLSLSEAFLEKQRERRTELYYLISDIYENGITQGYFRQNIQIKDIQDSLTNTLRLVMYFIFILKERPESYYWSFLEVLLHGVIQDNHKEYLIKLFSNKKPTLHLPDKIRLLSEI